MKTRTFLSTLMLLVLILTSCGQKGFIITGEISGEADGLQVFLITGGDEKETIDSTIIADNQFTFVGELPNPDLYNIKVVKSVPDADEKPKQRIWQPIIPIFLENSDITIHAELDSIPSELNILMRDYSYDNISIVGSSSHEEYVAFLNEKAPLDKIKDDIFMDEYIAYLNPKGGKEKGKISEGVAIVKRIDDAADMRKNFIMKFIKENKNYSIGIYAARISVGFFNVQEIEELVDVIKSGELKDSDAASNFYTKADETKISAEGAMFYDLEMEDHLGNPVKFSDYIGKGKYVLIDFWASWCGPCKADLPHLKEAYDLYHDAGFDVLSVSLDDKKDAWLSSIEEFELTWPQLSDLKAFEGPVSKKYSFRGIPTCILFGPDGKIVDRNMRGSWMDMILIDLYGNRFGDKF